MSSQITNGHILLITGFYALSVLCCLAGFRRVDKVLSNRIHTRPWIGDFVQVFSFVSFVPGINTLVVIVGGLVLFLFDDAP